MKFTQEDIENITDEIKQNLRYQSVEHVRDSSFNIVTDFWTETDFTNARDIGLAIEGVNPAYLGKGKVAGFDVDKYGIEIEVDYIGKHRIVMG